MWNNACTLRISSTSPFPTVLPVSLILKNAKNDILASSLPAEPNCLISPNHLHVMAFQNKIISALADVMWRIYTFILNVWRSSGKRDPVRPRKCLLPQEMASRWKSSGWKKPNAGLTNWPRASITWCRSWPGSSPPVNTSANPRGGRIKSGVGVSEGGRRRQDTHYRQVHCRKPIVVSRCLDCAPLFAARPRFLNYHEDHPNFTETSPLSCC